MSKKKTKYDKYFELTSEEVEEMTVSELKSAIKDMQGIANRRLKKIREDLTNPIISQISEKLYTQNFSSASNNKRNLQIEFGMITNFLQSKSSIAREWNKIQAEARSKFAGMAQEIMPTTGKEVRAFVENYFTHENQIKFWEAYRRADEEYDQHLSQRYASDTVLPDYYNVVAPKNAIGEMSAEQLVDIVVTSSKERYVKEQKGRASLFSNDVERLSGSSNGKRKDHSSGQKPKSKSKSVRKKSK